MPLPANESKPRRYLNADRRGQDLAELVGAKIGDAWYDSEGCPTLTLRLKDGTRIAVSVDADPESNGPGFLHAFDIYPHNAKGASV